MIITGLANLRMQLVVPPDTQRVVAAMTSGALDRRVNDYLRRVAARTAAVAVDEARDLVGGTGRLAPITNLSARMRHNEARRGMTNNPLYDTGKMRRGIYGVLEGTGARIGVRGPHAHLAMIHEHGTKFRVTDASVEFFTRFSWTRRRGGFQSDGDRIQAWALRNRGQVVDIPARPFLAPAMETAIRKVSADPRVSLAQDLFNIWTGARDTGNTYLQRHERPGRETFSEESDQAPEVGVSLGGGGDRA